MSSAHHKNPWRVITPHQASVARSFVAAREKELPHLVIYLSGAHAYGFPSPDSDLDLKCIHIAPTQQLVGLGVASPPPEKIETIDGVELDYGSNELLDALRGVLKGNGNFLERILGELALGGDHALLAEAREVVQPTLSRRVSRHYGGFATSQLRLFDEKPSAKRALYVLRTTATGRHLLATGELVTDVNHLGDYVPREIEELLAIKRAGEQAILAPDHAKAWRAKLVGAIELVDKAWAKSILPAEPTEQSIAALDAWLVVVRRRFWY